MKIKLSIITVVRNDIQGLKETLESFISYVSDEIEWVVIDGNSSDGTKEYLSELELPFMKWMSEKDRNMYDAMNKGINLSTGEYLQFLNAGDVWETDLRKSFLNRANNSDIIFYNIKKIDVNGKLVNWDLPLNFLDHLKSYPSVPHQSTFIKNKVFEDYGLYSEEYKYLGDYEFFSRIVTNSKDISYEYRLKETIVSFICNGVTFNYRLSLDLMKECSDIQIKYFESISRKTQLLYLSKYILSFIPYSMKIASFMRYFIKH